MKLLAIDPGSKELGLYDGNVAATLYLGEKNADRPDRLADLGVQLNDFIAEHGPYDFVAYEEQFVRGGATTKALFGVVGIIECTAVNSGAGVLSVPQSMIRKWAGEMAEWAGKVAGHEKEVYKTAAMTCAHVDMEFSSEHEYDAACVYYYVTQKGLVS